MRTEEKLINLNSKYLYILFEVTIGSYISSIENISNYVLVRVVSNNLKFNFKSNLIISKKESEIIILKNDFSKINCFEFDIDKFTFTKFKNNDLIVTIFNEPLIKLVPRVHQKNIISIKDVILFLNSPNYRSIIQELIITDIEILDTEILVRVEEILQILKLF